MRRFWYAKYALTLLASTALTFLLLYSGTSEKVTRENFTHAIKEPPDIVIHPTSYTFTKSTSYLRRKLTQGSLVTSNPKLLSSAWVVLPGNITVHQGDEIVSFEVPLEAKANNVCEDLKSDGHSLLIFVASKANHFSQRQAIRETWGLRLLQNAYNYRIVYLVGKGDTQTEALIVQEGYRYGDLVQINITESFRNLGRKSVAGLRWSKTFCPNANFVMKTDDDILVHVPLLLKSLASTKPTDSLLMCHENRMRKILRKELLVKAELPPSYQKYEVMQNELPGTFYPPYCSGMAYVFTSFVRDRLIEASWRTPIFFIEDVYLTGFCRFKAGIEITPHPGITLRPHIDVPQASCSFRDGRITSQEVSVEELRQLWFELNTQGFFCPQLLD